MLTNLDWIAPGKPFPPKSEKQRIKVYRENEMLFNGAHGAVFGKDFKEIEKRLKKRHADPMVVFNYPQLLTKKNSRLCLWGNAEYYGRKKEVGRFK